MDAPPLTDEDFFRTVARSRARALLIGRRALILLGAPVMTADFDLWVHIDDTALLNAAFEAEDHFPSRTPEEARGFGRYVIENGERIDVMVARSASTPDGHTLRFEDAWTRRVAVPVAEGVEAQLPSIEDLITTKRWASRPKDLADIAFLETLRRVAPT